MAATSQHPTDEPSTDVAPRGDGAREPSAEWGWHGTFPKATAIAGWVTVIAMFAMLIGNHTNYVEDVWLIALGALLVILLIGGHVKQRRSRQR